MDNEKRNTNFNLDRAEGIISDANEIISDLQEVKTWKEIDDENEDYKLMLLHYDDELGEVNDELFNALQKLDKKKCFDYIKAMEIASSVIDANIIRHLGWTVGAKGSLDTTKKLQQNSKKLPKKTLKLKLK